MPDIDTIIAKWKANFEGRTRYEGQEPREDELLVAEVERLQLVEANLAAALGEVVRLSSKNPPSDVAPDTGSRLGLCGMTAFVALKNTEPHPTEPGLYRRKEGES